MRTQTVYSTGAPPQIGTFGSTENQPHDLAFVPDANAAPGQVTGVTAGAASSTSISVSWDSVTNADDYHVQWSTTSGSYTDDDTQAVTITSTTITGLSVNTTYYIQVYARRSGANDGTPSTETSAATLLAPPGGVGTLTIGTRTTTTIPVDWSTALGATGYEIQWKVTTGTWADDASNATPSASQYTITSLPSGTSHNIRARATRDRRRTWSLEYRHGQHPQHHAG